MSAKTATKTPLVPGVTTNYAVKKANISFPPRTMRRALQRNGALRQTYDAPVAAAAVPEYAFVQLLFHAACAAGDKTTITPKHLRAARALVTGVHVGVGGDEDRLGVENQAVEVEDEGADHGKTAIRTGKGDRGKGKVRWRNAWADRRIDGRDGSESRPYRVSGSLG